MSAEYLHAFHLWVMVLSRSSLDEALALCRDAEVELTEPEIRLLIVSVRAQLTDLDDGLSLQLQQKLARQILKGPYDDIRCASLGSGLSKDDLSDLM